jgi:hypothetical protein
MPTRMAATSWCLVLLLAGACSSEPRSPAPANASAASGPPPGQTAAAPDAATRAAIDSARRSLDGFLHGSLDRASPPDYERYYACSPDGQNNYSLTLVDYHILDVKPRGRDTVAATAAVTSIATESDSATGGKSWHVVVGVREDTMTWLMTRNDSTHRWGVCGYSTEGWGFGHWGDDADSRWTPRGMSWARVHALADSLARARGVTR